MEDAEKLNAKIDALMGRFRGTEIDPNEASSKLSSLLD